MNEMQKEVYVIGAGCSYNFGLPLGLDLIQLIKEEISLNIDGRCISLIKKVANDTRFLEKTYKAFKKNDELAVLQQYGEVIYYSGASSIDDFLSQYHSDLIANTLCKLYIIKFILNGELRSIQNKQIKIHNNIINEKPLFSFNNNWLRTFFHYKLKKSSLQTLLNHLKEERKIHFIIFNYDRCIEHFIETALECYYNCSADDKPLIKDIMSEISFDHVYGSLSPLSKDSSDQNLMFGESFDCDSFSRYIKFFKNIEVIRDSKVPDKKKYQDLISQATKVFVLGLSFNKTNFSIFPDQMHDRMKTRITTYKMSDADILKAGSFIYDQFWGNFREGLFTVRDRTVDEFLRHDPHFHE